jgi:sulfonate transport system substrate-binding protein
LIGRASGLKTTVVLGSGSHSPTYVAVPAASDIRAIKELKGRKVALFRGTNIHLTAVKVLAASGLSEHDLQVINMDGATTSAALVANQVDAAFGTYELLNLARQGLASVIYSTKGDNPAFERHGTILARDAFVAESPEIVQRVVSALVRAAYWASQERNRDAVFEIWSKCGIPATIFGDDFAGQALAYRNSPLLDPFLIAQYKRQAEDARTYGLLRRPVDVAGWFDPRFLDVALQQAGLRDVWTTYGADGKPLRPA